MDKKYLPHLLYFITFIAVSIPVACGYICEGGIVIQWIARVDEIASGLSHGQFLLFPSEETALNTAGAVNALHSNLWLFLPGLVYLLTDSIVFSYQFYVLLIQLGTLLFSIMMFRRLFDDKISVFFGVLLYMTCPYRIYICYDEANLMQAVFWALLPLYVWAVLGVVKGIRTYQNIIWTALVLALMGYADGIMLLVVTGFTIIAIIFSKKPCLLLSIVVGIIAFLPGATRLIQYLMSDAFWDLQISLQSIMPKGYTIGQFFTSYAYLPGTPGLGLGLFISIAACVWLYFAAGQIKMQKDCRFFTAISLILIIMSLKLFPWDIFQRAGSVFLKLIPLIQSPAVFFGLACFALCVPAAFAIGKIYKSSNKAVAVGIPVIVLFSSIGLAIYLCNTLTYYRLPIQ